jgi:hypothetical protein
MVQPPPWRLTKTLPSKDVERGARPGASSAQVDEVHARTNIRREPDGDEGGTLLHDQQALRRGGQYHLLQHPAI